MSELTADNIFSQIIQLPSAERRKLRRLLDQFEHTEREPAKSQGENRLQPRQMPDSTREFRWLSEHARDYVGQWVALDGDRLIAHGPDAHAVFVAAEADGAYLPLVTRVEDPDNPIHILWG